jgi:ABC-type antimicrobial peptide transport system permease subunit
MNLNLLYFSFKNLKRFGLKFFILGFVLVVSLVIFMIFGAFIRSVITSEKLSLGDNIDLQTITVTNLERSQGEETNSGALNMITQEDIKVISKISNVEDIFSINQITPLYNNDFPAELDGSNFEPILFLNTVAVSDLEFQKSNWGIEEQIGIYEIYLSEFATNKFYKKPNVGDKIILTFTYIDTLNSTGGTGGQKEFEFNIAGFIDDTNAKYGNVLGQSLISKSFLEQTLYPLSKIKIDGFNKIYVKVDAIENLNRVAAEIIKLGFNASYSLQKSSTIEDNEKYLKNIQTIFLIITVFITSLISLLFYNQFLRDRMYDFGILKSVGFNSLHINMILGLELIIFCSIIVILIFVFSHGLIFVINNQVIAKGYADSLTSFDFGNEDFVQVSIVVFISIYLVNIYNLIRIARSYPANLLRF